jgi:hypothetical protein
MPMSQHDPNQSPGSNPRPSWRVWAKTLAISILSLIFAYLFVFFPFAEIFPIIDLPLYWLIIILIGAGLSLAFSLLSIRRYHDRLTLQLRRLSDRKKMTKISISFYLMMLLAFSFFPIFRLQMERNSNYTYGPMTACPQFIGAQCGPYIIEQGNFYQFIYNEITREKFSASDFSAEQQKWLSGYQPTNMDDTPPGFVDWPSGYRCAWQERNFPPNSLADYGKLTECNRGFIGGVNSVDENKVCDDFCWALNNVGEVK